MSEEEFVDDEYIDDENDPERIENITKDDDILAEEEETVGFEDVIQTVSPKNVNLTNYDKIMEKKVFDSLRKGELRKWSMNKIPFLMINL